MRLAAALAASEAAMQEVAAESRRLARAVRRLAVEGMPGCPCQGHGPVHVGGTAILAVVGVIHGRDPDRSGQAARATRGTCYGVLPARFSPSIASLLRGASSKAALYCSAARELRPCPS